MKLLNTLIAYCAFNTVAKCNINILDPVDENALACVYVMLARQV